MRTTPNRRGGTFLYRIRISWCAFTCNAFDMFFNAIKQNSLRQASTTTTQVQLFWEPNFWRRSRSKPVSILQTRHQDNEIQKMINKVEKIFQNKKMKKKWKINGKTLFSRRENLL